MTQAENPGAALTWVISAAARVCEFEKAIRSVAIKTADAKRAVENLHRFAAEASEPVAAWESEGGALEEYVK